MRWGKTGLDCKSHWCHWRLSKELHPVEKSPEASHPTNYGLPTLAKCYDPLGRWEEKLSIPGPTLDQWNQNLKRRHSDLSIFKAQVVLMWGQGRESLLNEEGFPPWSPSISLGNHHNLLRPSVYVASLLGRCSDHRLWNQTHLGLNSEFDI